jgi:hypothetical protein
MSRTVSLLLVMSPPLFMACGARAEDDAYLRFLIAANPALTGRAPRFHPGDRDHGVEPIEEMR